ncbi:MAG TPA: allantoicase [Gemmatimonadaceae bacterium]|nr:allantoicase [Gemmatimonadaceae bacterium]
MSQFTELVDLAAERLGGAVLLANDEFFAPKEALLKPGAPVWREGEYTDRGKWMDGWETRRRRSPGHDWCIVRLGLPGTIHGVVVDTSFFRGNYPEQCAIDATVVEGTPPIEDLADEKKTRWRSILQQSPLKGDSRNEFGIHGMPRATHLRLNIYPDGGVARLRVFGEPGFDPVNVRPDNETDLAAIENGGLVVGCSDMFFGHKHNLIMPGRSTHMGDGWETKRRRGPGHDWVIVRLAARGTVRRVEIDTDHFKGNAPSSCLIETLDSQTDAKSVNAPGGTWQTLLRQSPLQPHARHRFGELSHPNAATHARLSIYPDGGIARLRLYGTIV